MLIRLKKHQKEKIASFFLHFIYLNVLYFWKFKYQRETAENKEVMSMEK